MSEEYELCVYVCECKHALDDHECQDCDEYILIHREGNARGHHGGCLVKDCPCRDLKEISLTGVEAAVWLTEQKEKKNEPV